MGSDLSVVNAARVSFKKKSKWLVDEHREELYLAKEDVKLIKYLATHEHFSPFGHCFVSFHVKAPIFVARQLVKHKFLRWNEVSRRYVDEAPEFYHPPVWRGRSKDKKQGSSGEVTTYIQDYDTWANAARQYEALLEDGVAPEMARMVLPQSTMTEWYWSGSLDAFAEMCKLRLKDDTQYESRIVAQQIDKEMSNLFPYSWDALVH
jgi:thymidylate synthase (FAD)